MGFFSDLKDKIFGSSEDKATPAAEETAVEEGEAGVVGEAGDAAPEATPVAAAVPEPVDVEAQLDEMNANHPEDLDWRKSIVDLLKLVGMDSSYGSRKELAAEIGIEGYEGTAEDNIALNKAVLGKLAENGGKVPADLLD